MPEEDADVGPSGDTVQPSSSTPRLRARRWLVAAALSMAGAVVLGSVAGGWWVANRTLIASHKNSPAPKTGSASLDVPEFQMPDVRGLDEATAKQVLADAAIPVNAVSVHDAPSVAEPGVVVEQTPAFGANEVSQVELGIAAPVTMPDLAGKTQDEAVETLSSFGVGVTVTYAYSKDVTAGLVLSVRPAVGKTLGPTASVIVATSGSTLPLSQVYTTHGGCDTAEDVAINGSDYATALACSTETDVPADTTWVLSKTVDRFTATVGIADDEAPGASAPYQVLVDGKRVAKGTASFGASTKIDVPCTGAIQLTIRVGPASGEDVSVDFGNAVVYGSDQGIARLAKLQ